MSRALAISTYVIAVSLVIAAASRPTSADNGTDAEIAALQAQVAALQALVNSQGITTSTLQGQVTDLLGQKQFACVAADGTLGNHSTGVTSTKLTILGPGEYEVDFGTKDISACAPVATIGTNSATQPISPAQVPMGFISVAGDPSDGAHMPLDDDAETDSDAIYVQTAGTNGSALDLGFCLYVSCP